ncbi:hypothetical protein HIM_08275 [Hirsutella minnesotensis 3608]|uniref:Fe2OG dioxygenase domain-containing protein n=1 Tax=Hirsutella minnesotensis 3608 TaxID=1043627 RepID=A0A0F8A3S7_9HYPO|nr:hypothetical protein HIM_08275 [Hirsutella minnesotensis 3608]
MPTAKYFKQVPPFPSGLPLAPLQKLSLKKLQDADEQESASLFRAAREWGFCLIDLQSSAQGESLLQLAEKMFDLTTKTFALDYDELLRHAYNPPHDLTGYKRKGVLKTDDGKVDCMELYTVNQDDIVGNKPARSNAEPIEANRATIKQFIEQSHGVVDVVALQLERQLGLQPGAISSLSPLHEASDTSIRLLHAQPQSAKHREFITLGGHTDIDTITLLFNVVGGMQILPMGEERTGDKWLYVQPAPGHVIINFGDTLVEWTGGLLRTSLHRVVAAPGPQSSVIRRSVAYLQRPRASASMRRLVGGRIPLIQEAEDDWGDVPVDDWAASRVRQIILGQLKPETRGGTARRVQV